MSGQPLWFRMVYSAWFPSAMLGLTAYFTISVINDFTNAIPLWVRLLIGLLVGLAVRFGLWRLNRDVPQPPRQ